MANPEQNHSSKELENTPKKIEDKEKKEEPELELKKAWKEFDGVVENLLDLMKTGIESKEFKNKKLGKELSIKLGEDDHIKILAGEDINQFLDNFFKDAELTIGNSIDDINSKTDTNEKIAKLSEYKSHYNKLLTATKELIRKISEAIGEKSNPV